MSDAFWSALFSNLPSTLIALGTLVAVIINNIKLRNIHSQINSRMDQLIDTTSKSSKAEGVKEEYDRNKSRT
jgi:hypothetical protein